jgi:hypothetical protein
MKAFRLRIFVFLSWLGFWLLCSMLIALAAGVTRDVRADQVLGLIRNCTAIWLPAVSCFAAFWFPSNEREKAKIFTVPIERAVGAIALTSCFQFFALLVTAWPLYFVSYQTHGFNLPDGSSLEERMADAIGLITLISPLALAPVIWITRTDVVE